MGFARTHSPERPVTRVAWTGPSSDFAPLSPEERPRCSWHPDKPSPPSRVESWYRRRTNEGPKRLCHGVFGPTLDQTCCSSVLSALSPSIGRILATLRDRDLQIVTVDSINPASKGAENDGLNP